MSKKTVRGFTLIELVVVIVILGILAAFAVPRFMGLETEARIAAVRSMAGTLRSAATMAHGICMARNCTNGQTITIDGQNVTFQNGYPNNATVGALIAQMEGFEQQPNPNRFRKLGARNQGNCWIQYNQAAAGQSPTITYRLGLMTPANQATIENDLRAQC
jgi:MSHA pilin protein MshA